jgi:hypothetical protein
MATLKSKILGTPNGKIGQITTQKWKDKTIIRSVPAGYNDANSPNQQPQRENISFLDTWVKGFNPFIKFGFKIFSGANPWQNLFISRNSFVFDFDSEASIIASLKNFQLSGGFQFGCFPIDVQNTGLAGLQWNPSIFLLPAAFQNYRISIITGRIVSGSLIVDSIYTDIAVDAPISGFIPWDGTPFISCFLYLPGDRKRTQTRSVTEAFPNPYD